MLQPAFVDCKLDENAQLLERIASGARHDVPERDVAPAMRRLEASLSPLRCVTNGNGSAPGWGAKPS
jgi:hypothetical protein